LKCVQPHKITNKILKCTYIRDNTSKLKKNEKVCITKLNAKIYLKNVLKCSKVKMCYNKCRLLAKIVIV